MSIQEELDAMYANIARLCEKHKVDQDTLVNKVLDASQWGGEAVLTSDEATVVLNLLGG